MAIATILKKSVTGNQVSIFHRDRISAKVAGIGDKRSPVSISVIIGFSHLPLQGVAAKARRLTRRGGVCCAYS